jgi:flavin-dependent dehydrogenase
MRRCDALIVGGGPAGSTCARVLRQAGWQVLVIDRARFPRNKVCAGWVTPGVFRLLDLDPEDYRATGLTLQPITGFRTSIMGDRAVDTRYGRTISYAIRRCEFDAFLLERSGADLLQDTPLDSLERRRDRWIANGTIAARVVVGAGGHFCPVARRLSAARWSSTDAARAAADAARARSVEAWGMSDAARATADAAQALTARDVHLVVAREAEFRLEDDQSHADGEMPELFFCRDLEGYGWCVRKGGYLNIGLGRREHGDLNPHVEDFKRFLESRGLARNASLVKWHGHAYLASGAGTRPLIAEGMLLAGDAAGLAYPESGEGIKPAVESGRLAAETLIAADQRVGIADLQPYEAELRRRYPPAPPTPAALAGVTRALGRLLMRSPLFTRRVVIDRWFLRSDSRAVKARAAAAGRDLTRGP